MRNGHKLILSKKTWHRGSPRASKLRRETFGSEQINSMVGAILPFRAAFFLSRPKSWALSKYHISLPTVIQGFSFCLRHHSKTTISEIPVLIPAICYLIRSVPNSLGAPRGPERGPRGAWGVVEQLAVIPQDCRPQIRQQKTIL